MWASSIHRLQAMQKMQAAAGGKGRGANGMPTPAQIQAMQVSEISIGFRYLIILITAIDASRDVTADATADAEWRRHARNDEGHDARTRRRPDGYGRDAA
jgi:hypothetical protein